MLSGHVLLLSNQQENDFKGGFAGRDQSGRVSQLSMLKSILMQALFRPGGRP
jgi:hypothetical protein